MKRLTEYLPWFYGASAETIDIQQAIQPEIDLIWNAREALLAQLDPYTATWGLSFWEAAFGLKPSETEDMDSRRRAVTAKIRGVGTATLEMIRKTAEAQTGCSAEVIEYATQNSFDLWLRGMAADVSALNSVLSEIIPAHLQWNCRVEYPTIRAAVFFGGSFNSRSQMGIPEARYQLRFRDKFRTGGAGAIITTIPIPEGI